MKPTPPVLAGSSFTGHLGEFMKDRGGLFQRGFDTLGPIFSIRLLRSRAAVLIDPEYHQTFFMETDKKLSMHKTYKFLKASFGEVGFAGPPEVYNEQRPILHKPFKSDKVPNAVKIMHTEVQQWLDSLGEQGEFELTREITTLVQNVAAHALMGKEFRERAGNDFWKQYLIIGKALDPALPPNLPLPKFIRRDRAKNKLRAMLRPIIAERRANPDGYDDILQDYVTAHYKDGRKVEDETILSLILGLMFAGHETTAGQAAWTIIQLLQNPTYRRMMLQEVDTLLPVGHPLDAKVLSSLKHVFWAVQETTRMHPSAEMLIRLAEEDIEIGEYRIPKGWKLFVTAGVAQRLSSVFTDPDHYDPLRFAPDRAEDRKQRFSIIGFGGGVHKCAGMNFANNEMMVITSLLFQQFDLELVTKNPGTTHGMGASRPEKTNIRYSRKAQKKMI
jgi:sterol 14-demethylase